MGYRVPSVGKAQSKLITWKIVVSPVHTTFITKLKCQGGGTMTKNIVFLTLLICDS